MHGSDDIADGDNIGMVGAVDLLTYSECLHVIEQCRSFIAESSKCLRYLAT